MEIEKLTSIQYEILGELAIAMSALGASGGLLAIVGSWGDTLPEVEILQMIKDWNKQEGNYQTSMSMLSTHV